MSSATQDPHAPSTATGATRPRRAKERPWKFLAAAMIIIALARVFGLELYDGGEANPPAEIIAQTGNPEADYETIKTQFAAEQAVLARYESEHKEWATNSIEKMNKLLERLPERATQLSNSKNSAQADAFLADRREKLQVLAEEIERRLDAISRKMAEIDAMKQQLAEFESRLGLKPSSRQ